MATTNPTAEYWQRGESLDYANETAKVIPAGTVIDLKERIGVAGTDILPGRVGSIHVMGVYSMSKAEGKEIAMGAGVYFSAKDGTITDEADGNTPAGYAAAKAASADEVILVNIAYPPAKAAGGSGPVSLKLNDLTDVDAASPEDGQVLKYSDSDSKWKPQADNTAAAG